MANIKPQRRIVCPLCASKNGRFKIVDTKTFDADGNPNKDRPVIIRRRRECEICGFYFSAFEDIPNIEEEAQEWLKKHPRTK